MSFHAVVSMNAAEQQCQPDIETTYIQDKRKQQEKTTYIEETTNR